MYIVIEIQKMSESSVAIPTPIYTNANQDQAESEFHRLCSIAAVSTVQQHTIMMISDVGFVHKTESYEHLEGGK